MSHRSMALIAFCLIILGSAPAFAAAAKCEVDRPVRMAGLDWDSNRFHVEVAKFILRHGYGCESESLPGSTIPLLTGVARGHLDIVMEVWKGQLTEVWEKAEKAGKVRLLGVNFPDAVQGWFVPRYLVEGEDAPAKGLKSVEDLPRYKELFRDPEEPDKGRFYNCKLGWDCETINTKKLAVYGLDPDYTNLRPGSSAALAAAVASAFERKRPVLFYYWTPSWIMAKYDAVKLEEPSYQRGIWQALKDNDDPTRACAYPLINVYTGANTEFTEKAPAIAELLKKYRTSNQMVGDALLYIQQNKGADVDDAALHFLRTRQDVWKAWMPEDAAQRVTAALSAMDRKAQLE
jgi:glycine betaine/proline transport system substrate-binding protein